MTKLAKSNPQKGYSFKKYTKLRVNNYLILGFLIGIPLFIVGILAVKALYLEYETLESDREKAGLDFLRQIESEIKQVVELGVRKSVLQAERAIDDDPVEASRKLVLVGDIGFIVVFQGEKRIFPPEDTTQILVLERSIMTLLGGLLSSARQNMKKRETFQGLVNLEPSSSLQSILHCQTLKTNYEVCVLSRMDELRNSFQAVLDKYNNSYPQWKMSMINLSGAVVGDQDVKLEDDFNYKHRLGPPFQNWELRGKSLNDSPSSISRWSFLLSIIILSLLLSWVSLILFFYRHQQAKLKENVQRTQLAAKLSHELHTPLANLALYIDLLKRRASNVEDVHKYAEIMQNETDRLSRVSSSAIAVAQGEDESIDRDPDYPDRVIKKLLERFSVFFKNAKCEVSFNGNAPKSVLFDIAALESIVLQLLDNACKYGGSGKVSLATEMVADYLFISVRDYGLGIPQSERELIFKTNYRGKNSEKKGFGLGLATARHLARLNGGDIYVEDAKPGARFVASLKVRST